MIEPLRKPRPRVLERADKRQKAKTAYRDVCRAVDQRDGYKCRACGRNCDPRTLDSLKRGHHHHIQFRSRGGGDETANLVLVCAFCHTAIHQRELGVSGDANKTLRFYGVVDGKDGYWESHASGLILEDRA